MIEIPVEGIATDAAHSTKNKITEFQGIDLRTGKRIFYQNLGNKTVNIGEFLGVVEAAKYIIENDYSPRIIYTDSITAIAWFQNKKTASKKKCKELQKAEIFLKTLAWDVDTIEVRHWNNKEWGETPADFGNNKILQQENWRIEIYKSSLLEVFLPLKAQIMSAIDFNDAATSKSTLIRRHFLIVKAISTHAIGIYSQR